MDDYTPEQMLRFQELYNNLINAEKDIETWKNSPLVYQKRFLMIVFGRHIPDYEREVPEDVRKKLNFDIKGLAAKIKEAFS